MWLPLLLLLIALVLGIFLWVRLRYEPPAPAPEPAAPAPAGAAPEPQRRQFTRVPLKVEAELRVPDGRKVRGATRDLALMGAYVLADATLAPLTECDMFLHVAGPTGQHPVRLRLRGRVARADATGFAVTFTGMTRECYENLRYVLKYNAAAGQIDAESERHTLDIEDEAGGAPRP